MSKRHRPYSLSRPRAGPSSLRLYSPPDARGWRARGRCRRRFKIRISLRKCGSASRRATRTSLNARAHLRPSSSASPTVVNGMPAPGRAFRAAVLIGGFPIRGCLEPPPGLPSFLMACPAKTAGKPQRPHRQPAPGGRLILATRRSPGAARVRGRSVRLPPAGAASGSIIRRLMMTPLDRAGRNVTTIL